MKTKKTTKTETRATSPGPVKATSGAGGRLPPARPMANPAEWRPAPLVIAGTYEALKLEVYHRNLAASRQQAASAPPAAPTRQPETTVRKWRTPKGMIDEAATFFHVTRRTVQRWLKDPKKVPSEWAGFGSGVLASEKAWDDWKVGLGLRESGKNAIAKGSAALLGSGGWHLTGPRR